MRFIDFESDENNKLVIAKSRSGFANPISVIDIAKVAKIIGDVLDGQVAKQLFEGLDHLEITRTSVKLTFLFSVDDKHIAEVEERIGRKELSYHRVNFMMYVYAKVDEQFKLDDTLPMGFQDNLNMPEYIK